MKVAVSLHRVQFHLSTALFAHGCKEYAINLCTLDRSSKLLTTASVRLGPRSNSNFFIDPETNIHCSNAICDDVSALSSGIATAQTCPVNTSILAITFVFLLLVFGDVVCMSDATFENLFGGPATFVLACRLSSLSLETVHGAQLVNSAHTS